MSIKRQAMPALHRARTLLKSRKISISLVALVFALGGVIWLSTSNAATYVVAIEAEAGALAGNAAKSANAAASNSQIVAFGGTTPPTPPPTPPIPGVFSGPLKVSANKRYLVDQNNRPFFMTADTCWSCLTKLSVADAKRHIDLRKAQGYNTIMSNIVFPSRVETGPHGSPFQGSDMTKPNEAYFVAVDQIMNYAKDQGIIMYVGSFWKTDNGAACLAGFGGPSPFPTDAELRSYANYLGGRYKNQSNLVWFNGGDGNPDCKNTEMSNLGDYMKAAMPNIMISYHTWGKAPWTAGKSWLDFNSMQYNTNSPPYSYADIRDLAGWSPTKPAFNMEPAYDPNACCGSDRDTSELENRHNGWWAALSGALGVAYGGPRAAWFAGENGSLDTNAINRNGARHSGNIGKIMSPLNWHLLEPDWNNATVTNGRGSYGGTNYVTAGRASDGSLIIAYAPQATTLTINLARLSGSSSAQWYDPTTGSAVGSATSVVNSGTQNFGTPGNNSGGGQDWVLIIKR